MLRLGLGPQASGSINPHGSGGVLFLSSVIISGCDPSTSNGTYTRTSMGPTNQDDPDFPIIGANSFTSSSGSYIEWWGGSNGWRFYDQQANAYVFYNYSALGYMNEGDWQIGDGISFGTATNIYSPV